MEILGFRLFQCDRTDDRRVWRHIAEQDGCTYARYHSDPYRLRSSCGSFEHHTEQGLDDRPMIYAEEVAEYATTY